MWPDRRGGIGKGAAEWVLLKPGRDMMRVVRHPLSPPGTTISWLNVPSQEAIPVRGSPSAFSVSIKGCAVQHNRQAVQLAGSRAWRSVGAFCCLGLSVPERGLGDIRALPAASPQPCCDAGAVRCTLVRLDQLSEQPRRHARSAGQRQGRDPVGRAVRGVGPAAVGATPVHPRADQLYSWPTPATRWSRPTRASPP